MAKIGLVLGGGGSKGAYEVGVWQGLRELGITPSVVTGTSIGALNGALILQGDFEATREMWESMSYEAVLSNVSTEELTTLEGTRKALSTVLREILGEGGMDIEPLEKLVYETLDEEKVRRSPIELGVVTVELPKLSGLLQREEDEVTLELPSLREIMLSKEDIPRGQMAEYLLASAACFPAFKPRSIGSSQFIDGGYKNNLPIDFAVDLGAEEILAVDLEAPGFIPKVRKQDVPVRYLRSYWYLGGFMTFDPQLIKRNIRLGYLDTLKLYGKCEGYAYAFHPGEALRNLTRYHSRSQAIAAMLDMDLSEDNLNLTDILVRSRANKVLRQEREEPMSETETLLRGAEIAGEVLGVPPDKMYTFEEFNRLVVENYHHKENLDQTWLEEAIRNPASLPKAAHQLTSAENEEVVSLLYDWINDRLTGAVLGKNLKLAAVAAPREFLTAAYLWLLLHDGSGRETEKPEETERN